MGTIQGFTQRGRTGVMASVSVFPTLPEFEGLNASAMAVAVTLLVGAPHMRANIVGRAVRVTCTVTMGFTPNAW